jgi:hypothetical protein
MFPYFPAGHNCRNSGLGQKLPAAHKGQWDIPGRVAIVPVSQSEQALDAVCPVRFPYFPAGQGTVEVAFGQYDPFKQSKHCDVPFSNAMVPVSQSEQALDAVCPVRFPYFPGGQGDKNPPRQYDPNGHLLQLFDPEKE